jgi:hypothetical protein
LIVASAVLILVSSAHQPLAQAVIALAALSGGPAYLWMARRAPAQAKWLIVGAALIVTVTWLIIA